MQVLEPEVVFGLFEVVPPGEQRVLVLVEVLAVLVVLDVVGVALAVLLAEGRVCQSEVVGGFFYGV